MTLSRKATSQNELIEKYQSYTRRIVSRLVTSLHLPSENFDEYLAAGYLGLVEAAQRYDNTQESEFQTFAYLRIRGAIIDAIRASSLLSGRAYEYIRAMDAVRDNRERLSSGVPPVKPTSLDARKRLERMLDYMAQGALAYRLSIAELGEDELGLSSAVPTPSQCLGLREDRDLLQRCLARLPAKEQQVIRAYYFKDKSFVQIARECGIQSKSWVSRLHSRGLSQLKRYYMEELHTAQQIKLRPKVAVGAR